MKEKSKKDLNEEDENGGSINELLQFSLNDKKSY